MRFPLYEEAGDSNGGGGGGAPGGAPGGGSGASGAPGNGGGGSGGGTILGSFNSGGAGAGSSAGSGNGTSAPGAPGVSGNPPVTGDPFYKGLILADGTIDVKAWERLPPELQPFKENFGRYKNITELVASMAHKDSLIGKKGLMPLPEGASDADKAEFNSRMRSIMGTPEKPEGYGVKKPDDVPAEMWNQPYVESALGILHKHNASPALVKELLDADLKAGGSARQGFDQRNAQAVATSRAEIATAFGANAPAEIAGAVRVAGIMGLDVNDPKYGNDSKIIIGLSKMAKMFSEDSFVKAGSAGAGGGGGLMGGDPRQASLSIKMDPANPLHAAYRDPTHPRHVEATTRVYALDEQYVASQKRSA